jgi:protein-disulfide isomerase
MATLGGVVAVLVISFSNWREIDGIRSSIDSKLDQMDTRIAQMTTQLGQVSNRVNNISAGGGGQQARRGPDPNRVYTIKTDNAPYKGNANAPVTIAEFSDFQ